ncbi:SH3 domain-containing protein [Allomuricauda sp. d1]|uniref:SH3 domain-containing protein n=1 Tax=Allomuricauda sp. d1 TaxID=3136725 RepID=UPI0031DFE8A6
MKARQMLSILTILTICLFANAQEKYHCSYDECGFEPGEMVYLFGDDVKLRTAPTTESEVIKILNIGTELTVLEKTENSWPYRGIESNFYKVDYKGTTGYVLGGLLSLERKQLYGKTHLFGYAKNGELEYLYIRTLKPDGSFGEKSVRLSHGNLALKTMDNRGLNGVDGILYIDYLAEACGVEGGGIYLFQQDDELKQVARLSQVSEAGVFYHAEEFIFPHDQGGMPGKVLLKKEQGENLDETSNHIKRSVETRELVWADGRLTPDPKS